MKKTLITIGIVGAAVLALGFAGFSYAQAQNPGGGYSMMGQEGYENGHGRMGAGGYGHGRMGGFGEMGVLHEYLYPAMAEALGLTPDEFDARHEAGETFWEIAEAQGMTEEEVWDMMVQARSDAFAQAVGDGIISQETADEMLEHWDAMHTNGFGPYSGHCDGDRPQLGRGRGF